MSLKSWKREFYPITALQAVRYKLNVMELIGHAIRKWEGLLPENLAKHHVEIGAADVWDSKDVTQALDIDAHTCTLCRKFVNRRLEFTESSCKGCPIYNSRGHVRCFEYAENEPTHCAPWEMWVSESDPRPMLKALRKALKWAKAHPNG